MSILLFAQTPSWHQGWLTRHLLRATLSSAEWVVWLLAALSVVSLAIILERLTFFATHRLSNSEQLARLLSQGKLEEARVAVAHSKGLEAEVLRAGLAAAQEGPESVEEVIAGAVARERPRYERSLSFLGTLGNNAPFIGLFGTVLGIIKAFHDLGSVSLKGGAIQQTVMSGISEALVATAAGLAVAIPAVVSFNGFNRWLKGLTARATVLTHALLAHLRSCHPHTKVERGAISEVR